jgi:FkbM family methyltransferase
MNDGKADRGQEGALRLHLHDGLTIAVPPTLSSITCYVLLEQEEWFEKEINFLRVFLKPGMTAVDVGANLGVYSLPMARLVGPGGCVFSYEPGAEARALFEQSRGLNSLSNLEIIGAALSDSDREGHLGFAASSELRALETAGTGEPVHITSLDAEAAARAWRPVDFIKIDAEGAEEAVIAGALATLRRDRPQLVLEFNAARARDPDRLLGLLGDIYGGPRYLDLQGNVRDTTPSRLVSERFGIDWLVVYGSG